MQIVRLTTPLLITLLLTISVMAQESTAPSEPPDLVILEKNWRRQVVDPNGDRNESKHNEELRRLGRAQDSYLDNLRAQPNQPTVSKMPTSTAPKPVTPASQILIPIPTRSR
jgi:hypothetical protein